MITRSDLVAVGVVTGLAMSGCNLMPTKKGDGTVDDSVTTKGTVVGAGAGGLLAGLGTYLVTGDAKKAAAAAAIGAAMGGAAGYLYGREVYKDQAQFANTEGFLDHHVTTAVDNNEKIVSGNQKLETQITDFYTKVEALKTRYQEGEPTAQKDLQAERRKITTRLTSERENSKDLQTRIGNQRKAIQEANAKRGSLATSQTAKLAKLKEENKRFEKAVGQHSQLVGKLQTVSISDAFDV